MKRTVDFGKVLSVMDKRPYLLDASGIEKGPDSADKFNMLPLVYYLKSSEKSPGLPLVDLAIPVHVAVIKHFFGDKAVLGGNEGLDEFVIAFGLDRLRENVREGDVLLDRKAHGSFTTVAKEKESHLRIDCLEFFHIVNGHWPQHPLSVRDVRRWLYTDENVIKDWIQHWVDAELIVPVHKHEEFHISWGKVKVPAYRLNAKRWRDADEEISRYSAPVNAGVSSRNDRLRVFLSYSTNDKQIVGRVKDELCAYDMDVFLAHESIEVSKEWKDEIQRNLGECDIFVPVFSSNFRNSRWTDQEAGQAYAMKKPIIPLKIDLDPYGFLEKYQAEKVCDITLSTACSKVIRAIEGRLHVNLTRRM